MHKSTILNTITNLSVLQRTQHNNHSLTQSIHRERCFVALDVALGVHNRAEPRRGLELLAGDVVDVRGDGPAQQQKLALRRDKT